MNCCICGTVKNCEPYLNKIFENMEKIGSLFNDYRIVLYYDDSTDNTLNKLKEYQLKNSKFIFYVNKSPVSNVRTYNISKGRNYCLQYIRDKLPDYEMFIMMDCDDVNCKECNIDILEKYLKRDDWDALSFNTTPKYYDLWALSIKPYYLSLFSWKKRDEYSKLIYDNINNLLKNTPSGELLKCASAFNGFAIYRSNNFLNCNYDGHLKLNLLPLNYIFKDNNYLNDTLDVSVKYDCEHRSFHLEAIYKNDAKIRISSDILFT